MCPFNVYRIGSVIIWVCSDVLFQFSSVEWANFLAVNSVGAYAFAWVAGITFMVMESSPLLSSLYSIPLPFHFLPPSIGD
jgi:hypothetical protein